MWFATHFASGIVAMLDLLIEILRRNREAIVEELAGVLACEDGSTDRGLRSADAPRLLAGVLAALENAPGARDASPPPWRDYEFDVEQVAKGYGQLSSLLVRTVLREAPGIGGAAVDALHTCVLQSIIDASAEYAVRVDLELDSAARQHQNLLWLVTHELTSPLNSILGWVRLLRDDSVSVRRRRKVAEIIERNARAEATLLHRMLDAHQLGTGSLRIRPRALRFDDVVAAVVGSHRDTAASRGVRFTFDMRLEHGEVNGDAERLHQAVDAVIGNALKFTGTGGTIEIALFDDGPVLVLSVRDTGRGMDASFLPRLFQPFQQESVGLGRTHGGLGIGLFLAQRVIELHGGTLTGSSAGRDQGAVFAIRLPTIRGEPRP